MFLKLIAIHVELINQSECQTSTNKRMFSPLKAIYAAIVLNVSQYLEVVVEEKSPIAVNAVIKYFVINAYAVMTQKLIVKQTIHQDLSAGFHTNV